MNTLLKSLWIASVLMVSVLVLIGCGGDGGGGGNGGVVTPGGAADIIFLHHSTGENIWYGGVPEWFAQNAAQYSIVEQWFPSSSDNYPYDYWNIWVNRSGQDSTLESLTAQYHVIIFKHCFPVSEIEADTGNPNIASEEKRLENYYLQYNALKAKLHEFPNNLFIVWTGAVQVQSTIDAGMATRTRTFFDWVKTSWDEPGDNIYIWDFYELETGGGLYLRPEYASSSDDAHPNSTFSQMVAPWFCRRIVDVIEGRGDSTNLTGQ